MSEVNRPPLRVELEEVMLVAIGAIPGSLLRWQVTQTFQDQNLFVNLAGAATLGLLAGLPYEPRRHLLLGIGFCGSATTFSGLMISILELVLESSYLNAMGLLVMTLLCGVGAAGIGFFCGQKLRL